MNKRKKTAKGKVISQAEKQCCVQAIQRDIDTQIGDWHVLMTVVITTIPAVVNDC